MSSPLATGMSSPTTSQKTPATFASSRAAAASPHRNRSLDAARASSVRFEASASRRAALVAVAGGNDEFVEPSTAIQTAGASRSRAPGRPLRSAAKHLSFRGFHISNCGHKPPRSEMSHLMHVPIRESVGAALRYVRENLRFIAIVAGDVRRRLDLGVRCCARRAASGPRDHGGLRHRSGVLLRHFDRRGAVRRRSVRAAGATTAGVCGRRWRSSVSSWSSSCSSSPSRSASCSPPGRSAATSPICRARDPTSKPSCDVMARFVQDNPGASVRDAVLRGHLVVAHVAPLSRRARQRGCGRILTFETWKWTKGSMLRITGARLLLLVAGLYLHVCDRALIGRLIGFRPLDSASIRRR